jgi:hypothetical protein
VQLAAVNAAGLAAAAAMSDDRLEVLAGPTGTSAARERMQERLLLLQGLQARVFLLASV